jgi:hypothetical protein
MVPQTTAAFAGFLLLIAPGAFFELLHERRRPGRTESALREVSRIILSSVILSGVATAILSAIRIWQPDLMPDPGAWLRDGRRYVTDHYRLIGRTAGLELAIALSLAFLAHWVLTLGMTSSNRGESVWRTLFLSKLPTSPSPSEAFVRVEVDDGGVYFGTVAEFSNDFMVENRDLALAPPRLHYKAAPKCNTPAEIEALAEDHYTRVILPASVIRSIWISYQPKSGTHEPTRGSRVGCAVLWYGHRAAIPHKT